MNAQLSQLDSGFRIVTCELPHAQTSSVALMTGVGGRHEPASLNGISHFIEHLLFKGTMRRSARRIVEDIEGVGGDLNAYTTQENTCYHGATAAEFFPRLCDVLCDMFLHSRFAPADIEKERAVIAEEIQMYYDEPASRAQDLLGSLFWQGHPLGRPLTGTLSTLKKIDREDLCSYFQEHCHAANTVFVAAGRLNHHQVVELVAKEFSGFTARRTPPPLKAPPRPSQLRVAVEKRDIQQTQVALGFPAPGSHDPNRFAMSLLATMLAGNASSRLFQQLRERYGLCYSIGGHALPLADAGIFSLYLGLDCENLPRSLELIRREIEKLATEPPRRAELRRAQQYRIGISRMALERPADQTVNAAGSLLTYGRVVNPEENFDALRQVTPEQISAAAREYLDLHSLAVVVVGPAPSESEVRSALECPRAVRRARQSRKR